MHPNSHVPISPYMFSLKEGPKIRENCFDYQLELLQVYTKEIYPSPKQSQKRLPLGTPLLNRFCQFHPKAALETILTDMIENGMITPQEFACALSMSEELQKEELDSED
jgi:hypothetical protein